MNLSCRTVSHKQRDVCRRQVMMQFVRRMREGSNPLQRTGGSHTQLRYTLTQFEGCGHVTPPQAAPSRTGDDVGSTQISHRDENCFMKVRVNFKAAWTHHMVPDAEFRSEVGVHHPCCVFGTERRRI